MTSKEVQEQLLSFITHTFIVDRDEIELDKSIVDEGIIDSFGLVEISDFLQKTFAIEIEDKEITRSNFGSILKIVDFVIRKRT